MCLLIWKPENKEIPFEYLQEADRNNPHGCGISWADGKNTFIEKGELWHAENIKEQLDKIGKAPAIVHFRFKTHGDRTVENTHPFRLPKGWSAAHNGIIQSMECKDGESDTRAFLRNSVSPIIDYISEPDIKEMLEKKVGIYNKLAFLHATGEHIIINEKQGHWKDGVWYSNYGYKKPTYEYQNYTKRPPTPTLPPYKPYTPWMEFDKDDLRCQNCGFGIDQLGYGVKMKISRSTGAVICSACVINA